MKKYPSVRIIYNRKNRGDKTHKGTVEIEVLYQGKRKWYSTGVRIVTTEWSKKDKEMVKARSDADLLNQKILNMESSIKRYIQKLMLEDKDFSWTAFENFMKPGTNNGTFIQFIENTINLKTDLKAATIRNHKKLIKSLKECGKIIYFEDLTLPNIIEYDRWLHEKGYQQTTVASYHKFLKIYINDAIRAERIDKNPYISFKVDRGKPAIRKYLTPEELDKISNAILSSESFIKVRDLFLFQCYTGLAYADLSKFDFKNVIERNGKYVVHDVRQKTGEDYYIVLLSKAIEILKKYDYILPLITNQQYNMRLKIVAGAANLCKDLTSHMGRHTYACMVLNQGIPLEVLKEMMGHSDIKTTQIYAKMFNNTVEKAFDLLEEKLNN